MSIVGASLPALVGAFPLWLAVLLHEGSTLLVAINSVRLLGTFGRQPLRRSTVLACFGVFLACCAGGAWLYPTVRAGVTVWATSAVATPAFIGEEFIFILVSTICLTSCFFHSCVHGFQERLCGSSCGMFTHPDGP